MKENISALMDGELDGAQAKRVADELGSEGEALETWRTYHLISDAMRDTRLLTPGFAARVAERLEKEPTVLAPGRVRPEQRPWYALPAAAAASVAGVGLVGYLAFAPQQGGSPAPAPVAAVQPEAPSLQAQAPQRVPLPTATPDYLLAHQGFSPRLSLQGMAPYVRTVSDQANEGRRAAAR